MRRACMSCVNASTRQHVNTSIILQGQADSSYAHKCSPSYSRTQVQPLILTHTSAAPHTHARKCSPSYSRTQVHPLILTHASAAPHTHARKCSLSYSRTQVQPLILTHASAAPHTHARKSGSHTLARYWHACPSTRHNMVHVPLQKLLLCLNYCYRFYSTIVSVSTQHARHATV